MTNVTVVIIYRNVRLFLFLYFILLLVTFYLYYKRKRKKLEIDACISHRELVWIHLIKTELMKCLLKSLQKLNVTFIRPLPYHHGIELLNIFCTSILSNVGKFVDHFFLITCHKYYAFMNCGMKYVNIPYNHLLHNFDCKVGITNSQLRLFCALFVSHKYFFVWLPNYCIQFIDVM